MRHAHGFTVTSWWAHWRLKPPAFRWFTQPFVQVQIKESIKTPRHWPLLGESTGDRWIPLTQGQLRGKCFHLITSTPRRNRTLCEIDCCIPCAAVPAGDRRRNLMSYTIIPPSDACGRLLQLSANQFSLWSSDATRWHISESASTQAMASCLTPPSHYLNQYQLILNEVFWHSPRQFHSKSTR